MLILPHQLYYKNTIQQEAQGVVVYMNIYDCSHLRSIVQVKDLGNNFVLPNDSRKLLGIVMVQLPQVFNNLSRNKDEKTFNLFYFPWLNPPIAIRQISAMVKALQQRM